MIDGKNFNREILKDVDYEIAELVDLINQVDGIETVESCFGHNEEPIQIYCVARDIATLNKFIYEFFYRNDLISFKIYVTDVTIDNKEWDKVQFVIESDVRYIDFPCTQLIADNLTRTFREKMGEVIGTGIIQLVNGVNKNGRIYPAAILDLATKEYMKGE